MIHTESYFRFGVALALALATSVAPSRAEFGADMPAQQFPRIEKYGAVVSLPDAGERPRAGGKVVFDTSAAGPADKPN